MKLCTKCGANIDENTKFCPDCGAAAETITPPATTVIYTMTYRL